MICTVECQNYGVCQEQATSDGGKMELCMCQRHYSGRNCSFPHSACSRANCKQGSFCSVNECLCRNSSLHTGDDCGEVHCIGKTSLQLASITLIDIDLKFNLMITLFNEVVYALVWYEGYIETTILYPLGKFILKYFLIEVIPHSPDKCSRHFILIN